MTGIEQPKTLTMEEIRSGVRPKVGDILKVLLTEEEHGDDDFMDMAVNHARAETPKEVEKITGMKIRSQYQTSGPERGDTILVYKFTE